MLVDDYDEDIEDLRANDNLVDAQNSNVMDPTALHAMSLEKVKWGEIPNERDDNGVGRLAFGLEQQDVTMPIEGKLYY